MSFILGKYPTQFTGYNVLDLAPGAWWDSSDETTITTSGSDVSEWRDKSGNGNHWRQDISGYRPTYTTAAVNGLNAVTWPTTANTRHMRAINRPPTGFNAAEIYIIVKFGISNFSNYEGLINNYNAGDVAAWFTGSASSDSLFFPAQTDVYINGDNSTNRSSDLFPEMQGGCLLRLTKSTPFTSGTEFVDTNIILGNDRTYHDLNRGWRQYICEIVAVETALSPEDRLDLQSHLMTKWGIPAPDPFFANVSLLLPMTGTFTDASINQFPVTVNGAVISTAQSKWGPDSGLYDGFNDYCTVPGNAAFTFPGAFSAQMWVWSPIVDDNIDRTIIEIGTFSNGVLIRSDGTGVDSVYVNGTNIGDLRTEFTAATWQWVSLTRDDDDLVELAIDGVVILSATVSGTVNSTGGGVSIGRFSGFGGIQYYLGHQQDVRITKGVARPHTVPTTRLPVSAGDVDFASVLLLMKLNGANGSTTFSDSSSYERSITPVGGMTISTAQSMFGGASGLFDGTNDRLDFPEIITSGRAYTAEAWVYAVVDFDYRGIFSGRPNPNGTTLRTTPTGQLQLVNSALTNAITTTATLSLNTWHHVAITNTAAGITTIWIDGVDSGSADQSASTAHRFDYIGWGGSGAEYWRGHIDEARISDFCRYTTGFTPIGPFATV